MKYAFHKVNSRKGHVMLNLLELEQLIAFADFGMLSRAAK